jgi:hypothetical protein
LFQVLLAWATRHVSLLSSTLHYPQTTEIHQNFASQLKMSLLCLSLS